jgi:hypothetical protein
MLDRRVEVPMETDDVFVRLSTQENASERNSSEGVLMLFYEIDGNAFRRSIHTERTFNTMPLTIFH